MAYQRSPNLRRALGLLALLAGGCRPSAGPISAAPPSGPPDLETALSARWTASARPVGEERDGCHADFDLKVSVELRNASTARVEAGRTGYVVVEAPHLDIAPVAALTLGAFSLEPGAAKTLEYTEPLRARAQGRKLWLGGLRVRAACTAPIAVSLTRAGRVVIVGRFAGPGSAEGKTEIWHYTEAFLQSKAGSRDEWEARVGERLLEDLRASR